MLDQNIYCPDCGKVVGAWPYRHESTPERDRSTPPVACGGNGRHPAPTEHSHGMRCFGLVERVTVTYPETRTSSTHDRYVGPASPYFLLFALAFGVRKKEGAHHRLLRIGGKIFVWTPFQKGWWNKLRSMFVPPREDTPSLHPLTKEKRKATFRIIDRLFTRWGCARGDRAQLLNLDALSFARARRNSILPENGESLIRAELILTIFNLLGTIYAFDPGVADRWIKRRNWRKPFYGATPLDAMKDGGLPIFKELIALLEDKILAGGGIALAGSTTPFERYVGYSEFYGLESGRPDHRDDPDLLALLLLSALEAWDIDDPDDIARLSGVRFERLVRIAGAAECPDEPTTRHMRDILTVHIGLRYIFRGACATDGVTDENAPVRHWLHTPNRTFGGETTIDLLRSGNAIATARVAHYIRDKTYTEGTGI